jgi:exonuclease SbcD
VRLLHTADLHLGLTRYGTSTGAGNTRVLDFRATLDRLVNEAISHGAAVVVLAGDTFNSRRESPEDRAAFTRAIRRLTEAGITVIIVPGNHDGMTTVGDEGSHALRYLAELALPGVHVMTRPEIIDVQTGAGPLSLTALPYPHKRAFDEPLRHLDPDERVLEAGRRLERAIATLAESLSGDAPRLFVGHLTVGGSTAGSEVSMKFTWDVAIRGDVLAPWDYGALGHIHRRQPIPGTNAHYAGSPEYIDFAEVNDPKGFLLVDVIRGRKPTVQHITSGARPMQVVTLHDVEQALRAEQVILPGAIVKLIVDTGGRPKPSALNALVARARGQGASFVKLDVVRPAAAPEQRLPVEGLDVLEATRAYLVAKGHPEEPAMTAARQLVAAQ